MPRIDLSAPRSGSFGISASDLGLSSAKFSKIQVDFETEQSGEGMRVLLDISAEALLECDRTLREFVTPVSNSYELFLYHSGQNPPEDDLTELVELDPGQRIYDLTDVIRDILILAIPIRKVAPGAKEMQIQTVYGAPAPDADPRWSALLAMREELSL